MKNIRLQLGEGEILLDRLLQDDVHIGHDCGGKLACSSCCVVVSEGLESLEPAAEDELDMLDRAGASIPNARLACQVKGLASEILVCIPEARAPVPASVRTISLGERAAEHLAGQLEKHPRAMGVRLRVEEAGCSGFGYRVEAADALGEDDAVFEQDGVRLVVDAASLPYLQGTRIELADAGLGRRLRFDNPNARESCGCGESFGV